MNFFLFSLSYMDRTLSSVSLFYINISVVRIGPVVCLYYYLSTLLCYTDEELHFTLLVMIYYTLINMYCLKFKYFLTD